MQLIMSMFDTWVTKKIIAPPVLNEVSRSTQRAIVRFCQFRSALVLRPLAPFFAGILIMSQLDDKLLAGGRTLSLDHWEKCTHDHL